MAADSKLSRTALITGISGFTGMHLEQRLLENGIGVYGTTLGAPTAANHKCIDLNDTASLNNFINEIKPNYIFHLAAISFVASKNERAIYETNLLGTLSLLDAIEGASHSPDKVLIASSAAVYGNREGALSENLCPMPVNHYGISKLAMEKAALAKCNSAPVIIARPFNYTGVGQAEKFLIPKLVSHFKERRPVIELGNVSVFREFNDVSDVADTYTKLIMSQSDSETVNICSGNSYSIEEILNVLTSLTGHKIKIRINEEFVRKDEISVLKGDPTLLQSMVGETFKTGLESTLKTMLGA